MLVVGIENWSDDSRGVLAVVVDCVCCFLSISRELDRQGFPVLWIRFIEWGSGTGDCDSDLVPFVKTLADPTDRERHFVDFAWCHEDLFVETFAITGTQRVVDDQY